MTMGVRCQEVAGPTETTGGRQWLSDGPLTPQKEETMRSGAALQVALHTTGPALLFRPLTLRQRNRPTAMQRFVLVTHGSSISSYHFCLVGYTCTGPVCEL